MPKYRVQLKQGSKTFVEHIEAKSLQAVLDFFALISTAKVTEVLKVEYEDTTKQPVDDMNYYPVCKLMLSNSANHVSRQVVVHNVKLTKNLTDVINASKQYLEVSGFPVTSSYSSLLKSPL